MLSEIAVSNVGSWYNTPSGTSSTAAGIVRGVWEEVTATGVSGLRRTVTATRGGATVQEWDYGTAGLTVTLRFRRLGYVSYAALYALSIVAATTYAAHLVTRRLTSVGAEVAFDFTKLHFLEPVSFSIKEAGSNASYRDVVAKLVSVE